MDFEEVNHWSNCRIVDWEESGKTVNIDASILLLNVTSHVFLCVLSLSTVLNTFGSAVIVRSVIIKGALMCG